MKSRSSRFPAAAATLGLALYAAAPLSAQESHSSPPGGLFGGGGAPDPRHKFDLSVSAIQGHDSDAPTAIASVDPLAALSSGYSTGLRGMGEYRWRGSHMQVGATGASDLRYLSRLEELRSVSHTGGIGLSARLGGRSTMSLDGRAAYSPSYLFGLFPDPAGASTPGEAMPAAPDYATRDAASYTYGTSASLTHGLSRRSRLTTSGDFGYTDFLREDAAQQDATSHGFTGGYSRNVTRNVLVNAEYRFRAGTFGSGVGADLPEGDDRTTEQGAVVGVAYVRPLSATREFHLRFNFGSSLVKGPFSTEDGFVRGRGYRFSGDADVVYQFSRTWQAMGTFRRGLEFVAQLTEPVFVDGTTVGVRGLLSPRLDLQTSARYATGESALNRTTLAFDTYGGDARLRYALTRSMAVYGEYLYYFYDFSGGTPQSLPTLAAGLERHAIRAGLTLWLPVVRK